MDPDVYFNEWAFMAKTDPEVFEQRREQCISKLLSRCGPHRQQLQALQAKIDEQRKLANSPLEAVVAISGLMCNSLDDLACVLNRFFVDPEDMGPQSAVSGDAVGPINSSAAKSDAMP